MRFPKLKHWSNCALHNAPALPPEPCDCGVNAAQGKPVRYLFQVLRILLHPLKRQLQLLLWRIFLPPSGASILEPPRIRCPRLFGSKGPLLPLFVWLRKRTLLSRVCVRGIELPTALLSE